MIKKIKKTCVVLPVVLLVLAIVPWSLGFIVKSKVQQMLYLFDRSPIFSIETSNYDQGWFNSSANFNIKVFNPFDIYDNSASQLNEITQLNATCQIIHGPLLWQFEKFFDSNYGKGMVHCEAVVPSQASTAVIYIDSIIHINGSFDINFSAPDFSAKLKKHKIDMQNFVAAIQINPSFGKVKINSSIGNMVLTGSRDSTLGIQALKFDSNLLYIKQGIWSGPRTLKVGHIDLGHTQFYQLSIKETTHIVPEVVNKQLDIDIEKIHYGGDHATMGPLHLLLRLNNLEAEAYVELVSEWHNWLHEADIDSESYDNLTEKMATLIPQLLSHGFRANLQQLVLDTSHGKLTVYGFLSLPDKQGSEAELHDLMLNSDSSLVFSLPKVFFQNLVIEIIGKDNAGAYIDKLLQQKVIIEDGEEYEFSVMYKNRVLYINEQPMNDIKLDDLQSP